jgi:putative addiction module component (TIGR02574 family)
MTKAGKKLITEARRLSPEERLELVDNVLGSLHDGDASTDQLWSREAADRLAAYRRGELKAVALQEILAKYRVA